MRLDVTLPFTQTLENLAVLARGYLLDLLSTRSVHGRVNIVLCEFE